MLESGGKSQPKPVDPGLDISVPAHGQTDLGPNPNTFAIRAGRGNSCRPACTFSRNSRSSVAIRSRSRTSRSFVSIVCRTNCWLQHEATARPLRRRSGNGSPWSRFCNDSDLLAEDLRTVEAEALTLALQAKGRILTFPAFWEPSCFPPLCARFPGTCSTRAIRFWARFVSSPRGGHVSLGSLPQDLRATGGAGVAGVRVVCRDRLHLRETGNAQWFPSAWRGLFPARRRRLRGLFLDRRFLWILANAGRGARRNRRMEGAAPQLATDQSSRGRIFVA